MSVALSKRPNRVGVSLPSHGMSVALSKGPNRVGVSLPVNGVSSF
jgi:hypothetical protein